MGGAGDTRVRLARREWRTVVFQWFENIYRISLTSLALTAGKPPEVISCLLAASAR